MLAKWSLNNFKSFSDSGDIDLAPITVLAGANSSGKSTIIQSLLLLKQTVLYNNPNRPLGLNGPILKLGRFDDIKNINTEQKTIGFSWTLTDASSYHNYERNSSYIVPYFGYRQRFQIRKIDCSVRFSVIEDPGANKLVRAALSTSELQQLQPALDAVKMRTEYSDGIEKDAPIRKNEVSLVHRRFDRSPQYYGADAALGNIKNLFSMKIDYMDSETTSQVTENRPGSTLVGATTKHFLPSQIGYTYNKRRDVSSKIATMLTSYRSYPSYMYDADVVGTIVPQVVANLLVKTIMTAVHSSNVPTGATYIKKLLESAVTRTLDGQQSVKELFDTTSNILRYLPDRPKNEVVNALNSIQSEVESMLLARIDVDNDMGFEASAPYAIESAADLTISFFQHAIRYLGPLRDEPKPIYPLEAVANPTDVGYKGEHTAAVLDLNKDKEIKYVSSAYVGSPTDAPQTETTLQDAVIDWLIYLGVAQSIRTGDRGKMGHELQVRTKDVFLHHDLTNVGVGVSQVLPIIVMALLAPIPSTLIFEQPELHLHPRVQTRLADFFISLGLCGRQCILETHSEYLVERLRRRIAETEGSSLQSKINIYFTHVEDGNTVCEPVEITEYGAVKNWPKDFFDQSQDETSELLKAAQRKLKNQKTKNRP
ncbi:AAA domain-containing protein [Methylobacterium sp. 275MFSha3.1]|uniref:AAA family ATPase n=1 Tax=Methylobacterium sp. 275MFSha3.1 TaxID=1502746 RepID=UPI0008A73428|nr:DUF3696 domain-containing protein [Methylobacterium sp. 275MFSha3.1]SEI01598.1 AAA domain-containing protein [Methylobacterium sp. 275MFSha3.1]